MSDLLCSLRVQSYQPMTRSHRTYPVRITEHNSVKLLMQRMGMTKKEVLEINHHYGVSASKLIELMQMSKYKFVNRTDRLK